MFDRENIIVIEDSNGADEIFPPFFIMAVSDTAEYPAASFDVTIALGVKVAITRRVLRVNECVLGMTMEQCSSFGNLADCNQWVNPLPP